MLHYVTGNSIFALWCFYHRSAPTYRRMAAEGWQTASRRCDGPRSITVIASKLDLWENFRLAWTVARRQVAKIAKRVEWLKRTRRDATACDLLAGDNEMDARWKDLEITDSLASSAWETVLANSLSSTSPFRKFFLLNPLSLYPGFRRILKSNLIESS